MQTTDIEKDIEGATAFTLKQATQWCTPPFGKFHDKFCKGDNGYIPPKNRIKYVMYAQKAYSEAYRNHGTNITLEDKRNIISALAVCIMNNIIVTFARNKNGFVTPSLVRIEDASALLDKDEVKVIKGQLKLVCSEILRGVSHIDNLLKEDLLFDIDLSVPTRAVELLFDFVHDSLTWSAKWNTTLMEKCELYSDADDVLSRMEDTGVENYDIMERDDGGVYLVPCGK